jgi:outer membrane protein assembly factor BamB
MERTMKTWKVLLAALSLAALVLLPALAAPVPAAADEAAITFAPPVSLAGKTVKLKATGFAGREKVQIYFDDAALKKVRASRAGKISTQIKVPKGTPAGAYPLKAVGLNSGISASAAFTVKATPPPAITLNPTAGTAATTVTVTGANFKKKDVGTIYFDGDAVGLTQASATTGGFSVTFPVPDGADLGAHAVTAYFTKSAGFAQAAFTVQANPAASLTDNPTSGLAGVKVTLTGAAFGVSEAVDLLFDGSSVANAKSSAAGAFTQDCYVPEYESPGAHTFTAVGKESGQIAQAAFTVNSPAGATISLSPNFGPPTTRLLVSGSNFEKNAPVDILLYGYAGVSTSSNSSGAIAEYLTIPSSTPPGRHYVEAFGGGKTALAPFQVRTDWPQFRFNLRHSGYNPFENVINTGNVSSLDLAWTATTGGMVQSSPAVVGGVVYVGASDKNLYAFDALTGAVKSGWPKLLSNMVDSSSPAVANGVVYIGDLGGKLYAFNASTGALLSGWPVTAGNAIESSPAVANGVVYVASWDGKVYAFDAVSGTPKAGWPVTTTGPINSSPAVVNGVVYVASTDGKLYAFDAVTGGPKPGWPVTTGGLYWSSPAVANGVVYVGSTNTQLYAFNAVTGAAVPGWPLALPGPIAWSSPAVANGWVHVGCDNNFFCSINTATVTGWGLPTGGMVRSSPAVANGVAYVSSDDGKLYAFNATAPTQLWAGAAGASIFSSPCVSDGMVYVGSQDGKLRAYSTTASLAPRRDAAPPDPDKLTPDYNLFLKP